MITRLFPSQSNVYQKGPVGENVFHIALLLNTPSTLAIAKYLVKLYGKTLVNTPYQVRRCTHSMGRSQGWAACRVGHCAHAACAWMLAVLQCRGASPIARPPQSSERAAHGPSAPSVLLVAPALTQERKHEHDTPGLYEGETALHIAIVNRDFDMVRCGAHRRCHSHGLAAGTAAPQQPTPPQQASPPCAPRLISLQVKFLIQSGAEVRARCYGGFFQLGSPVYYGERRR